MKKLDVHFTRRPGEALSVGTLAEDRNGVCFEYAPDFLATGLNLSPFHLPFEAGLFVHRDLEFGMLPGLFDDSLPDGWGLLLMDRHFRALGRDPAGISPLDRLSRLGTRTMGALTYHPSADSVGAGSGLFDLHELARQSGEVLAGSAGDLLPELLRAGGSPGGARSKVLVGFNPGTDHLLSGEDDLPDGYEHWIVKFTAGADGPDSGAVEYAYSLMARSAGIDMADTRLFETSAGDRFFGTRRFDRDGNRRRHVHTFGNLIQADFRIPSSDYADLLKAASMLTRNHRDVLRAFRRMVFNVAAHNRDDHVKNFAFTLDDVTGEWTLSPAYDLLFTPGPGGEHSMTIDGEGRAPGRPHILSLAGQVGIPAREAAAIIGEVLAAVAGWPGCAAEAGVSRARAKSFARSFLVDM